MKTPKTKCSRCGWNKHPCGLDIHHVLTKKKQKRNGKIIVLCSNCHRLEHWGERATQKRLLERQSLLIKCEACNELVKSAFTIAVNGITYTLCDKCYDKMEQHAYSGDIDDSESFLLSSMENRREDWIKSKQKEEI